MTDEKKIELAAKGGVPKARKRSELEVLSPTRWRLTERLGRDGLQLRIKIDLDRPLTPPDPRGMIVITNRLSSVK